MILDTRKYSFKANLIWLFMLIHRLGTKSIISFPTHMFLIHFWSTRRISTPHCSRKSSTNSSDQWYI